MPAVNAGPCSPTGTGIFASARLSRTRSGVPQSLQIRSGSREMTSRSAQCSRIDREKSVTGSSPNALSNASGPPIADWMAFHSGGEPGACAVSR